ncbi:putative bifunctional diguanylate cyclase/phosphodiesterase [Sphingomonas sp. XXL09]|uniref:putative bifunctional diguanylate cyclase/phosphodiesterase n=1 Tax=Sphingomonas sp. XXL09 TaxID=3457787 RepID=UPI00406BD93D
MPILSATSHRIKILIVLAIGLFVGASLIASGLDRHADRLFDPLRAIAAPRAPSGKIVVVEMDEASVAAIRQWPWPRDHYAMVTDRLRRAGAASVTFDVDLSSANTPAGDRSLAAALARADGMVALPTFAQQARSGDRRSIDALPLAMFRPHVALASVSMQPDSDGVVRRAPFGTITAGTPRPSLSAYIAKRSGSADTFFPIDFGLNPERLPRLSFIDVRDGRFAPDAVRGRDILIGATAIEMGDRYATPHWGVVPGVIVQALAAETLLRGVPTFGSAAIPIALALLLGALAVVPRRLVSAWLLAAAAPIGLASLAIVAQSTLGVVYPVTAAMAVLVVVQGLWLMLRLADRAEQQRCIDEDTGIGNQRAIIRDFGSAVPAPILVAQVGNFDTVVTLLGERAGHDLILRLAERLRIAAADAAVYRIGDRLLAMRLDMSAEERVDFQEGLRALLTQPVEILGRRVDAAVHVGIADQGQGLHDRLIDATRAANEAAAEGVFRRDSTVDVEAMERRLVLMGELDQAIARGEIEVHYQPKLDIGTDRITSVEALVRWRHPVRGLIGPDAFIPFAEQSDRIGPLTLYVIERTMRDLGQWREHGLMLTGAINLSATLIALPAFAQAVDTLLAGNIVSPEHLIFEVTESATLADPERAAATLRRFRAQGVGISMDDYGTGQSTLSYLRQLPLTELKIDRSFVQHAAHNHADALMVRSTIALAHDLGLKVVAEGIEDQDCLAFLRTAGCDMAQGYLISRPLPVDALGALLRNRLAA